MDSSMVKKERAAKPALSIELIEIILSYLPVKSLLRFKSVSKEWNSLIPSPYFTNLHRHDNHRFVIGYNSRNTCLETRAIDSNLTLTNKFFLPKQYDDKKDKYVEVVDSCRGLVVLKVSYTNDDLNDQEDLIMWNPSINNYMVLPPVHFANSQERGSHYGFGYDKSTNDYKLVTFAYVLDDQGNYKRSQRVYSAKQNSWGPPHIEDNMIHWSNEHAVVDDHVLHWLFTGNQPNNRKVELWGLNICTEKWLRLPRPFPALIAGYRYDYEVLHVGVLDDCLCLVSFNKLDVRTNVWVMKEYGVKESWTRLLSLSYVAFGINISFMTAPIAYSDGQLLIALSCQIGKFFWYNLKDKTLKPTGNSDRLTHTLCTESFVPIPISDPTKEQVTGSFDRESMMKVKEDRELEEGSRSVLNFQDFFKKIKIFRIFN